MAKKSPTPQSMAKRDKVYYSLQKVRTQNGQCITP